MARLNASMHEIWDAQFWGPVTATLDWCEVSTSKKNTRGSIGLR